MKKGLLFWHQDSRKNEKFGDYFFRFKSLYNASWMTMQRWHGLETVFRMKEKNNKIPDFLFNFWSFVWFFICFFILFYLFSTFYNCSFFWIFQSFYFLCCFWFFASFPNFSDFSNSCIFLNFKNMLLILSLVIKFPNSSSIPLETGWLLSLSSDLASSLFFPCESSFLIELSEKK